jgi:uncharacterized membrane protein YuzA (DUF378 family)
MTTIRTILTRKKRRYFLALLFAIPATFILFILGTINTIFGLIGVACFPLVLLLLFGLQFSIRCPECRGILGFALNWPITWDFSVSKEIKFCQRCGVNLDKEIATGDKQK